VLELGVGDASLTQRLFEAGAIVDGIEIDMVSADLARPYCRSVIVNDLDDIQNVKLNEQYDLVIAADVLEHLRVYLYFVFGLGIKHEYE
jgi:2-polyprenyl-3-methyl-5-hydroxy-6-metoxy-1,4-benzoquinol methylase